MLVPSAERLWRRKVGLRLRDGNPIFDRSDDLMCGVLGLLAAIGRECYCSGRKVQRAHQSTDSTIAELLYASN